MKVEWMNDTYTRARVTRGWFRKVSAVVVPLSYGAGQYWKYESSGRDCEGWLNIAIRETRPVAHGSEWQPVVELPNARLVERNR